MGLARDRPPGITSVAFFIRTFIGVFAEPGRPEQAEEITWARVRVYQCSYFQCASTCTHSISSLQLLGLDGTYRFLVSSYIHVYTYSTEMHMCNTVYTCMSYPPNAFLISMGWSISSIGACNVADLSCVCTHHQFQWVSLSVPTLYLSTVMCIYTMAILHWNQEFFHFQFQFGVYVICVYVCEDTTVFSPQYLCPTKLADWQQLLLHFGSWLVV